MRDRGTRLAVALLCLCAAAPAPAADAPGPPTARYDAARQQMQRGDYAGAERAFRAVADDESAPADLRAQALFSAGMMQQNQRQYEAALETFLAVQRRFPTAPAAARAADAASTLTEGGPTTGVAFRRGFDAMVDAYTRGRDAVARDGFRAGRADLERAAALADAVLHDFPDHPRLREVAFQAAEIDVARWQFARAQRGYERALALAATAPEGDAFVVHVRAQLAEAVRMQRRWWATLVAWLVLAAIGVAFVRARPWSAVDADQVRIGAGLAIGVLLLAVAAEAVSYWIRVHVDEHSPLNDGMAAMLVAAPALVGETIALGFLACLRRDGGASAPWPRRAAAALGALAALAVAVCVVNRYELFGFLDSLL